VCSAVHDACGLDAELEWPNDLVAGGRKIAGILAEAVSTDSSVHAVVLGVGVNVSPATHAPDVQARAVSLSQAVGETVDRGAVLEALLVAVPAMCRRLWQGDADAILREWRQRAPSAVGAEVSWDTPAGERHGVTSGVDDTGALLVKTSKGVERIVAGEIRWS
jgi:BirA family biotin operon repressor/biotin-[acetyl-CoA-carboxylase] ligase